MWWSSKQLIFAFACPDAAINIQKRWHKVSFSLSFQWHLTMVGLMKLHVSLLPSLDSSLLVAFRTHLCFSRPAEWKPYVLYYFSNIFAVEFWSHKDEKNPKPCYWPVTSVSVRRRKNDLTKPISSKRQVPRKSDSSGLNLCLLENRNTVS